MDAFDVLGVEPGATPEQMTAAWKAAARLTHPDMFPEATPEQRRYLNERMANLNAAYAEVSDPARLAELRRLRAAAASSAGAGAAAGSAAGSTSQPPRYRPSSTSSAPSVDCDLCGSVPAAPFSFTQVTGMLLADRIRTLDATLCRECALGIGREMQSRTLVSGWWGVLAVFRNLAAIVGNAVALRRAARQPDSMSPTGRRTYPLPVGPSLFRRGRTWLGLTLVVLLAGGVVSALAEPSGSTSSRPSGGVSSANSPVGGSATYDSPRVGLCVQGYSSVDVVSCLAPHSGKIVSTASMAYGCPDWAESYIEWRGTVYCIDDDQ